MKLKILHLHMEVIILHFLPPTLALSPTYYLPPLAASIINTQDGCVWLAEKRVSLQGESPFLRT